MPQDAPIANLVHWVIRNPTDLSLTFVSRTSGEIRKVNLARAANGNVQLILANVPITDLKQLPPNAPGDPTDHPDSARHFHAFYTMLHKGPDAVPALLHRIPHDFTAIAGSCKVALSLSPRERIAGADTVAFSIGTYACMPSSGTPP